jgi:hypothetical protein
MLDCQFSAFGNSVHRFATAVHPHRCVLSQHSRICVGRAAEHGEVLNLLNLSVAVSFTKWPLFECKFPMRIKSSAEAARSVGHVSEPKSEPNERQQEFLINENPSLLREPGDKGSGGSSDGSKLCPKVQKREVEVQLKK